uniref:C2H2-type domain-containing protein n=1 Tax=Lutzomyia longipalpis TaxID=7200 RepID=A0A1B0GKT2_LUTLO
METTDTEGSLPVNLDIVKEEYSVQDEVAFVGEVQDVDQDKEGSLERTQFVVEEVQPDGRRKCTYCCPKCPKTFPARNNLTIHMKVHTFHDSLTCVTCGKTFKNRRRLLAHLKTHHDAKFECKECGKKFKSRTSMKPHILKVHHGMSDFEVSGKKLTCTVCREVFPTDWKYEKHRRTSHGGIVDVAPPIVEFVTREGVGDEGAFPCPKCPKVFRAQKFLGSHLRAHSDDQLVCDTCGKTFEERLSLVEHLKSHEFDAKKKLESHWFYHTAIRKHECSACGKKFKTLPALRTHYKFVHTDERPFVCNICGDAFKKRPDLRNHGLTHMELKVFDRIPCKLCGKTFKRPVYLKNHLRIYHAEKME